MATVMVLAALFEGFGSASLAVTLAVLVIMPAVLGIIVMEMVALEPLPKVPMAQVTIPLRFVQSPWLGIADWKVTLLGNTSVTTALVAANGPKLVMVTV